MRTARTSTVGPLRETGVLPDTPVSTRSFERWRAPYAATPRSRGRLVNEPGSPTRTRVPARPRPDRPRDGVPPAKHKTQVFVSDEGDHYRTRLTHTIEVAQIARALARALGLDEDLAEALALAHDLGHHAFRPYRRRCARRLHAAHWRLRPQRPGLRIVTRLEQRYADFDGLNLTWETLEGLVKHNGPLPMPDGRRRRYARAACRPRSSIHRRHDLELSTLRQRRGAGRGHRRRHRL